MVEDRIAAAPVGRWTLANGQIARDGEPLLVLVRACWGDDAMPAAELSALERRIVELLNAAEAES